MDYESYGVGLRSQVQGLCDAGRPTRGVGRFGHSIVKLRYLRSNKMFFFWPSFSGPPFFLRGASFGGPLALGVRSGIQRACKLGEMGIYQLGQLGAWGWLQAGPGHVRLKAVSCHRWQDQ